MKGISLPINAVILMAIVALVLVVVSAFFISGTSQSGEALDHATAWNLGCATSRARGCLTNHFEDNGLDIDGYTDNRGTPQKLITACDKFLGINDPAQCRIQCCGGGVQQQNNVESDEETTEPQVDCSILDEYNCAQKTNCRWLPLHRTCTE